MSYPPGPHHPQPGPYRPPAPRYGQPGFQPPYPPRPPQPGPYPPQPQQPYGPPGYPPPVTGIAITARDIRQERSGALRVVFLLSVVATRMPTYLGRHDPPQIEINDAPMRCETWGRTVLPLPPGRHKVRVFVPSFGGPYGPAGALVDVYPGQLVELEYRPPIQRVLSTPGSLGPAPQPTNGMSTFLLMNVMPLVLIALIVVVTFGFAGVMWLLEP